VALILHNWQTGVRRLLSAPQDLPETAPLREQSIEREAASPRHRQLFEQYVRRLQWAVSIAARWWEGLVQKTVERGETPEEALRSNYLISPAGPASRPEVVWVVRTFWIDCEAINKEVNEGERVPPEVFLIGWLLDGSYREEVEVLSGMPYWPIGLDEDGNWI
jgi:hypothetical protein